MPALLGKLVLVTGAGSGIGRAACQLFSKEGAKVIAADIDLNRAQNTVALLNDIDEHLPLQVDVTNLQNVGLSLKKIMKRFSNPPTVVVNSAGITRDNFLLKMSEEDFNAVINTNLNGTFNIMQTFGNALANMDPSPGGSFINIASIAGKIANIGQSNYNASKVGVEALTKTAAKEWGKFNIRCNVLLPGFIRTPMVETVPDKVIEGILRQVPLRRMGKPSEIAEVIVFLASDKSSYVNGATIEITGGFF
ncbi:estradiol 17-beta-dehydrogenase 8 [Chrysoperla carnea]|uniref:estradiol 17-beta-dehydrogenase 8 n=1 Tax=Chrysoperla carnea TaxID=189513 RepID=UPI001D0939D3|nr:estradiol 17-beta-dehydrogenase 8 [Chrysoperla carnea]